jgi:glucose-1-phosphate thymidylyltransferase
VKGLILSGGKGTRLRPITHTAAKQLVPVANKPVLFYGLEAFAEAGIRQIGMVVGDTHEEIRAAVGDGSAWGLEVTYLQQEAPLGLAHAVKIAQDYLGEEPFVMYLGDNLILAGIKTIVEEYRANEANCQILLARVPNPQQFGVAELSNGKVFRLVEKPKEPKSDLALVGVYVFDRHIFEAVNAIQPSWRNELEITDAIQYLIDHGYHVHPHLVEGWWKDTGKIEDMLEANRMILDRLGQTIHGEVDRHSTIEFKVQVAKSAIIRRSTIRGPAIIGENTLIEDSYVGPFTSIHDNVVIRQSEIEHSIVLENSVIEEIHTRIEDSLIGKNVKIRRSQQKPVALRFMVGDNSEVGIL